MPRQILHVIVCVGGSTVVLMLGCDSVAARLTVRTWVSSCVSKQCSDCLRDFSDLRG